MKTTIENYRGFDIEFDTDYEKFQCIIADSDTKESKSYAAVKKFIDEYIKNNQFFAPFWVESVPDRDGEKVLITGIRKDDRFIYEDATGEKQQLSSYNLSSYMLYDPANKEKINKLSELSEDFGRKRLEYIESKKKIIETMNIITLEDHKKTLIQ